MHRSEHIKRIDFTIACCNSDGEPVKGTEKELVVMFNDKIISVEEVHKLIDSGMYEYDERVVTITKIQADNLAGFTREEADIMQQFDSNEEVFQSFKDFKDELIEEIRHETNSEKNKKLESLYKKVIDEVAKFSDDFYNNVRKYNELRENFEVIIKNN